MHFPHIAPHHTKDRIMYCPEHGIIIRKHLQVWHIQQADVPRQYVTWREVLNPLRYDICIGPGPGRYWRWNRGAWMNRAVSNLWFRVWGHRKYKR